MAVMVQCPECKMCCPCLKYHRCGVGEIVDEQKVIRKRIVSYLLGKGK